MFAHRGASACAPENTLPAFDLALRHGADVLETDVHWTRDGVLVVAHDSDISRVSDGQGSIESLTYTELCRYDFGYRFTTDNGRTYPYRGTGVRILRLRELFERYPRVPVNLDIKPRRPASLRQLIAEISGAGAADRTVVGSFHHDVLQAFRAFTSAIATSASPREVAFALVQCISRIGMPSAALPYRALQVPIRMYGIEVVTRRLVEWAHRSGCAVHVWTVDAPGEMERLFELGVDGVMTNRPQLGVAVRNKWLASARENGRWPRR
ncbi:MAG: glycerophosphodiester phosphodiesterase [Alicyclobacillus sp.]|nr:glycerophosphodiester phosphodiesterase [Alicyclobacillus sp.]